MSSRQLYLDGPVVAVVPARGGSKGVPRKNLRDLGGKPLFMWSVEAAQIARTVSHVVVSTEDPEIAEQARRYGVDVIERPSHLASDIARLDGTILHASDMLHGQGVDHAWVVTLQPTSPFRRAADIDVGVQTLRASSAASLLSVRPVDCTPELMLRLADRAERFDHELPTPYRRQDWAPVYQPNGAVYISHLDQLATGRVLEAEPAYLVMDCLGAGLDLDTPLDFAIAETLLRVHPEVGDPRRLRGPGEVPRLWDALRAQASADAA